MDDPSVKWSQNRYNAIIVALKPSISKCGYDPEKDCIFIPVSGINGDNLKESVSKTVCSWYSGPTLLEILEELVMPPGNNPIRVPLPFKIKDRKAVIFEKVDSDKAEIGDQLNEVPPMIKKLKK